MKQKISKGRRFIESFLLIGVFTLFITLVVGQGGSKVGSGAQVPLKSETKAWCPSSVDDYLNCSCVTVYDEDRLQSWLNNHPQLSFKRIGTDPKSDTVVEATIQLKYKGRTPEYLTLRISKHGRMYLDVLDIKENCEGISSPACCFYYQNICYAMQWLFCWIDFKCSDTFWKCWIWNDCYQNDYYHNKLFWILWKLFFCCNGC